MCLWDCVWFFVLVDWLDLQFPASAGISITRLCARVMRIGNLVSCGARLWIVILGWVGGVNVVFGWGEWDFLVNCEYYVEYGSVLCLGYGAVGR